MPSAANNGNYIKLFRKFKKWGWYSDPNTKAVFIHLLLSASWQDTEFLGHKIHAGECVFGRKKAAQELGLSERQVRTALDHLRKSGEISTTKTTNRFSIIKIEKWSFYQGRETESDHQNDQASTSKRPASDHVQEGKEYKEGKEVCVSRAREAEPSFEAQAIINYLNEATGRSFRASDPKTMSLIEDRLREGYMVSHFCTVIDNKVRHWGSDLEREQFLTPKVLFSADHFADYLAQTPVKAQSHRKGAAEKILGRIRRGDSPVRLTEEERKLIDPRLYAELVRKQETMSDDEITERIAKG